MDNKVQMSASDALQLIATLTAERDALAKRLAEVKKLLSEAQARMSPLACRDWLMEEIDDCLNHTPSQEQEDMVMVRREDLETILDSWITDKAPSKAFDAYDRLKAALEGKAARATEGNDG